MSTGLGPNRAAPLGPNTTSMWEEFQVSITWGGGASISIEMMVIIPYGDSIRLRRVWIADNCLLYCFDGCVSVHQMGSSLPGYIPACHHSTAVFAM